MVGVGTKNAQLDKSAYQFCSLLGSDKESWGFSYTGKPMFVKLCYQLGRGNYANNVVGIQD